MSSDGRSRRTATAATLATAFGALFWCSLAAEVAWLILATAAESAVSSVLDGKARGLVHLLILCALAFSSGLLLALERRANVSDDPEHHSTLAKTLYALALFGSLFFGVYAFFGWYYSP